MPGQTLELLVAPDVETAEAIVTGCAHGRRRQSVVVERRSLALAARNVRGMVDGIDEARRLEAAPDNRSTMGWRTSSIGLGLGHFEVRGYGPNIDARDYPPELRGLLRIRAWTRRRGYPALDVTLDAAGALELAAVLERGADPEKVGPHHWQAEG